MEESQPSERKSHPSIMARVQKLRTRMYVEAVSGVPATSEDLFLPVCLRYEQREDLLFTGQAHWGDWGNFDDFTDFNKFNR